MTRFCPSCGTEVDETALFCPTCGQAIDAVTQNEAPAVAPAAAWPEPGSDAVYARPEATEPPPAPPSPVVPAVEASPHRVVPPGSRQREISVLLTLPRVVSGWLVGVGVAMAAVGVLVSLFSLPFNVIDILLLL